MTITGLNIDLASGEDRMSLAIMRGSKVHMIVDRDTLNKSDAGRKSGREYIAEAICAIVERHGATVERHESPTVVGFGGAGIDLRFSLKGVGAMIDIDDLFGGSRSLIHWHNTEYPSRNFTTRFCRLVGSDCLRRPFPKATSRPADWYSLAMRLDAGLCLALANEAFVPVVDS